MEKAFNNANKLINNFLNTKVYDNPVASSVLSLFLVLYAGLAAPKLPKSIAKLFGNEIFRLVILVLIAYMSSKDASLAIIAAISLIISLQTLSFHEANEVVSSTISEETAALTIDQEVDEKPSEGIIEEEPIIQEPAMIEEEPIMAEPIMEEPIMEEPIMAEPIMEEPIMEEPIMEEPIMEEPIMEEPIAVESDMMEEPLFEQQFAPAPLPVEITNEFNEIEQTTEQPIDVNPMQESEFSEGQTLESQELLESIPDAPIYLNQVENQEVESDEGSDEEYLEAEITDVPQASDSEFGFAEYKSMIEHTHKLVHDNSNRLDNLEMLHKKPIATKKVEESVETQSEIMPYDYLVHAEY